MNRGKSSSAEINDFTITVIDSLVSAEIVWRDFETAPNHYVFQTYDWLSLWHKHIGVHERVRPYVVLIARRDHDPSILLPLAIEKKSGIKRLVWLGGKESDYHGPLLAKEYAAQFDGEAFPEIWAEVLRLLPPVDVVFLERQPATIGDQKNPFMALECIPYLDDAHLTRLEGSWETYYQSKRSRKTRKRLRNYEHGLSKHGELNYRVLDVADEIRPIAAELFARKSRRHRETGVPDLFDDVGREEFFTSAVLETPLRDKVKIAALTVGSDIAAATLFVVYNSRIYDILPVYDTEKFGKYSVGTIFLMMNIQWCFENNISIYDFTIGDDQYKEQWCEETTHLFHHMMPRTIKGRCLVSFRKLRNQLREVAWLKSGLRTARSLVSRARRQPSTRS